MPKCQRHCAMACVPERARRIVLRVVTMCARFASRWEAKTQWGYGATAARLTPDQKVGSSNLSALIFPTMRFPGCGLEIPCQGARAHPRTDSEQGIGHAHRNRAHYTHTACTYASRGRQPTVAEAHKRRACICGQAPCSLQGAHRTAMAHDTPVRSDLQPPGDVWCNTPSGVARDAAPRPLRRPPRARARSAADPCEARGVQQVRK